MADAANSSRSVLIATYMEKRANLVRFFSARTSSTGEAEDIVQEIYMRIAGLDAADVENPPAYLYRLGTNIMLDRARSRRRALVRDDAYYRAHHDTGSGEAQAEAPSPEEAWQARARLARVLAMIERMPPRRRQVFVMHKIDGLSHREIAASLRISRSAVEKLIMAALRDLMNGEA